MTDMLVKLYDFRGRTLDDAGLDSAGIRIVRAMTLDRAKILKFVTAEFYNICPGWVDECDASLLRQPATCFIAVIGDEPVGFCCYDGSAKGFIGPLGVVEQYRCRGIARSLLLHTCHAMLAAGYAYAVLGWVSSEQFYAKALNAIPIPNSAPGIYHRLLTPPDN